MSRRCPTCQQLVDDDRLVACPRCHDSLAIFPQVPTIGQEQEDRIVSHVIDSLSKSGPMLDKLVKPIVVRIVKSVHWWIAFPLFWIAVLVGSHFTIKGALESLMISRIDREFKDEKIQETMQRVVNTKAKEMLENTIQPEVNRFRHEITKQMEDFQAFLEKEYQTVSEEVSKLKQRNHLAILADRAISQADRQALNELISTAKKSETNDTRTAANAEIARIVSYWVYMSRTETMSISAQFPDRTSKKDDEIPTNRLIADIQEHPEWSVRAVVARLLKQRKEKGVPEILLKTALTDNNLEVVKHAVISFRAVTEAKVWGFFDFDGLEQWWKEHSAEVNERLRPLQGQ